MLLPSGSSSGSSTEWTDIAKLLLKKSENEPRPDIDVSCERTLRRDLKKGMEAWKSRMKSEEGKKLEAERRQIFAQLTPEQPADFLGALEVFKTAQQKKVDEAKAAAKIAIAQTQDRAAATRGRLFWNTTSQGIEENLQTLSCAQLQQEISFILEVSNALDIPVEEVTLDAKQQYLVKKRKEEEEKSHAMAAKLMAEERKKKKAKSKRAASKKVITKKEVNPPISNQETATGTSTIPKIDSQPKAGFVTEKVDKSVPKKPSMNMFDATKKDRDIVEHPRVTNRWQTKDPHLLRKITDVVNGVPVCKYAGMSDQEILKHRANHFMPGLEKLIAFPDTRAEYTFKTKTGYGMIAQMNYNGTNHEGIIYLGVENLPDNSQKIYHKQFTEINPDEPLFSGDRSEGVENLDAKWEPVRKSAIQTIANNCLKITFKREEHEVIIYPVRKS